MDNFIVPLNRMQTLGLDTMHSVQTAPQNETIVPFSEVFSGMVNTVQETNQAVKGSEVATAVGDVDRLHDLTIASTKAELALALFVQLRNKGHDAYSEIIRMSV